MSMGTIAARQLDEFLKRENCVVIDLRSEKDFNHFHINGAINIPSNVFWNEVRRFAKDKIYVLYCERGGKSTSIARDLSRRGFNAISVIGGIDAYKGKRLQ